MAVSEYRRRRDVALLREFVRKCKSEKLKLEGLRLLLKADGVTHGKADAEAPADEIDKPDAEVASELAKLLDKETK